MLAVVFADFIDRNDRGMIQASRRFSFDMKALHGSGGGELTRQNHFQRDGSIQAHLPRPEDHAHAAARNLFDQFVVTEIADGSLLDFRLCT